MSDEDPDFCIHKPASVENAGGGFHCFPSAPSGHGHTPRTSSKPRRWPSRLLAFAIDLVLLAALTVILVPAYALAGVVEGVREAYQALWCPESDLHKPKTTKDP